MGCNCKIVQGILAVLIIIFTFWQTVASEWIIVVAAIIILIHSLCCKNCGMCCEKEKPAKRRK